MLPYCPAGGKGVGGSIINESMCQTAETSCVGTARDAGKIHSEQKIVLCNRLDLDGSHGSDRSEKFESWDTVASFFFHRCSSYCDSRDNVARNGMKNDVRFFTTTRRWMFVVSTRTVS